MIESGVWTLQAPRQLLNIANIQSVSWSGTEIVQVAKHVWFLWKRALKSVKKCTRGTLLKMFYLRGTKRILEMQIGHFNKTAPVCKAKKTQEWWANFPSISSEDMISSPYSLSLIPMDYSV
ncbi:hypothetical protein TNCV_5020161 [Trichonephila clavipes]|nr:hypothetical protein TNCV_5020161 [Trichonephila clavipes]